MSAASDSTELRPMPGSYGPPLIRRLLDSGEFFLAGNWKRFFLRRQKRFGSNVFRINMFQPTVALLDYDAIAPLFSDPSLVQDYGFSWAKPPLGLVGGVPPSVFRAGESHDKYKAVYIAMIKERASALEPAINKCMDRYFDQWSQPGSFKWRDETDRLAVEVVFEWLLGARPDTEKVRTLYKWIFFHAAPTLEGLIPFSNYSRSLRIYRELLQVIKDSPGFADVVRLASAQGLEDEDEMAKQFLFLLGMNSFLGIQALFKIIIGEMSRLPGLVDKLNLELSGLPQSDRQSLRKIATLPLLDNTMCEMFRLHAPVALVFGRTTKPHVIHSRTGTFAVDKGELLMGVIPFAHFDREDFADPEQFNPDRYASGESKDRLIWPRGQQGAVVTASDRTCPGKDVAVLIGKAFCTRLTQYHWRLDKPPNFKHWFFLLNVAAPKGDLLVHDFGLLP